MSFGAVRGKGFEDDSAGFVVPGVLELGHGGVGSFSSNVSS